MNISFENGNGEAGKTLKKAPLDRTLYKNTGLNSVYLYTSKVLYPFHITFLIIKARLRLKKYLFPSFPKNKIHSSTHDTHILFNFSIKYLYIYIL